MDRRKLTLPSKPQDRGAASKPETDALRRARALERLSIGVVTADDTAAKDLLRELQRTRAAVQHIAPGPEPLPASFDVLYCDLCSSLPQRLPWVTGEPTSALVLVVRPQQNLDLSLLENCAPHSVVHLPLAPQAALTSLSIAYGLFRYERRLRQRIEKLDDNLRTTRTVEQAKLILMRGKGLSEEDAYNHLRKQAMHRRVSIGALASAIVDTQDLIG